MKPTIINAIQACQDEKDSNILLTIKYESLESIIDLSGVTRFKDGEPELSAFPFTFEDVLLKKMNFRRNTMHRSMPETDRQSIQA